MARASRSTVRAEHPAAQVREYLAALPPGSRRVKHHVSLDPVSSAMKRAGANELSAFKILKGTIRFPLLAPLPTALVKRLVVARVAEARSGIRP